MQYSPTDSISLAGKSYTAADIVKEKDVYIRLEAIDNHFALKELANDQSSMIRIAVARKKVGHEKLIKDKNWRVRATVAQHCDDKTLIERLIKDTNDFVRFIIAKRGLCADQLINDPDQEIAAIARFELEKFQAA